MNTFSYSIKLPVSVSLGPLLCWCPCLSISFCPFRKLIPQTVIIDEFRVDCKHFKSICDYFATLLNELWNMNGFVERKPGLICCEIK